MLPQTFPSYPHSGDQGWTSENSRSILRCTVLQSAATCSTLCNILSCSLTGKWRTIFFCLTRSTDPRRRLVQRADRPRSHRRLLLRSRRPPTDRGPRTTGRHGSPTAMVDGHCHLPHGDQLLTPPGGFNSPERVDRVSFGVAMLTISTLILTDCLQWRMAVRLTWTNLSRANHPHDVELLDNEPTSTHETF